MAKTKAPATPAPVRVYPHPSLLKRGEYLAGVGIDGADVAPELADEWFKAGLATRRAPRRATRVTLPKEA
jgi:hypothetical protein